jgi:hypothetical protein
MSQWDEMAEYIGQTLHLSSVPHDIFDFQPSTKKIDDIKMLGYRAYFSMKLPQTHLPVDKAGWTAWWHSRNVLKADAFGSNDNILLTDHKALTQPKKFFEEATKPLSSKHINALNVDGKVIASDTGIEGALLDYTVVGIKKNVN